MLLTELTHSAPRLALRRVEELYELLEWYGDKAVRAAISRAVAHGRLSVAEVERGLVDEEGGQLLRLPAARGGA